jgi:hypothetical protein
MAENITQVNDVLARNRTGCTVEAAQGGGFDLYRGQEHLMYCPDGTSSIELVGAIRKADEAVATGNGGESFGQTVKTFFGVGVGLGAGEVLGRTAMSAVIIGVGSLFCGGD